ncbi:unnamed protein product, partial [Didymodactylos carnosus]
NASKKEIDILPTILSQITAVDYLPNFNDIRELRLLFDKYDQEETISMLSKLTRENDQRTISGKYCLIDPSISTKNKYVNINDFYFDIENSSLSVEENTSHCT